MRKRLKKSPDLKIDRGYTGHEHWEHFGLINMNGRVYDPQLGRFLSPDPTYQSLTNSQVLNKYSYVINNPLKYTDPSGYNFKPDYWNSGGGGAYYNIMQYFKRGGRFDFNAYNPLYSILSNQYSYSEKSENYYDGMGNLVSFDEVYNN